MLENRSVGEMSELNCRAVEMNPPRLEMGLTELNRSVGEMIKLDYSAVNNWCAETRSQMMTNRNSN